MTTENQNQRIIFSPDSNPVDTILDILKNNGIKEIEEGKPSRLKIISDTTKDLVSGKITYKELIPSLQQQMEISENVSKKVADDIKAKLIPLTMKVPADGEKEKEKVSLSPIKKPVFPNVEENEKYSKKITVKKLEKSRKSSEIAGETSKIIKQTISNKPKPNGPDTYREPIE